jgi:hypothetical protein
MNQINEFAMISRTGKSRQRIILLVRGLPTTRDNGLLKD